MPWMIGSFWIGGLAAVATALVACKDRRAPPDPGLEPAAALAELEPAERSYFRELAFGSGADAVRKWVQPVRVGLEGDPGRDDRRAVAAAVAELNSWVPRPGVRLVESDAGVIIHFWPRARFKDQADAQWPFSYRFDWSAELELTAVNVFIATEGLPQRRRSRFVYEGLARALGFPNTSRRQIESIFFYGPGFAAWDYRPLDRDLVRALYRPEIPPGTTAEAFDAALEQLGDAP